MKHDPLYEETARIVQAQPLDRYERRFFSLGQIGSLEDLQKELDFLQKQSRPLLQKAVKKQKFLTTVLDFSLDSQSLLAQAAQEIEKLTGLIQELSSRLSSRKLDIQALRKLDERFRQILMNLQKQEQYLKQDQMTLQMELQDLASLFLTLEQTVAFLEGLKDQITSLLLSKEQESLSSSSSFFWSKLYEQYEQSVQELKQVQLALAQQQAFLIETRQNHYLLEQQLERIQAISVAALIQALMKKGYDQQMETLFQSVSRFISINPVLKTQSYAVLEEPGETLQKLRNFLNQIHS